MLTEIGFGVSTTSWKIRIGWRNEFSGWLPGHISDGKYQPANSFDAPMERDWEYGWLWFVLYFIRAYGVRK